MKVNFFVHILFVLLLTHFAEAKGNRGTASVNSESNGLDCRVEYKQVGRLNWTDLSGDSGHLILGEESKKTLTNSFGGVVVALESLSINQQDYFRISVRFKNIELLNLVNKWGNVQVTRSIDYTFESPDQETILKFDQLRVTCDPVSLAG